MERNAKLVGYLYNIQYKGKPLYKYLDIDKDGLWNGNFKAGTVVYDIEDFFYKIGQDIQAWSITAKGKIITIIAAHHDGINLYKLKALNQAGIDLAAEYEDSCNYGVPESDRKFHAKLFNSRKYIADLKMFG